MEINVSIPPLHLQVTRPLFSNLGVGANHQVFHKVQINLLQIDWAYIANEQKGILLFNLWLNNTVSKRDQYLLYLIRSHKTHTIPMKLYKNV